MTLSEDLRDEIREKGAQGIVIIVEGAKMNYSWEGMGTAWAYGVVSDIQKDLAKKLLAEMPKDLTPAE